MLGQENNKAIEEIKILIIFTRAVSSPTGPFTIVEPKDQEIGQFYVFQERWATDFKALTL